MNFVPFLCFLWSVCFGVIFTYMLVLVYIRRLICYYLYIMLLMVDVIVSIKLTYLDTIVISLVLV